MISFKKWPWTLCASILAITLWTWIGVNTGLFWADNKFDYFWYLASYATTIGIWALIALEINISEKLYKIISIVVFTLMPFFCMQISMILAGSAEFSFGTYFINVLFYAVLMILVLGVTRSLRWSAIITVVLSFSFNISIFIVSIFRGTPLIPIDFLAVGTAVHVLGNYTFQLKYQMIVVTIIASFVIALAAKFSFKLKFRMKNLVLPVSGVAVALMFVLCMSFVDYSDIEMDFFDQYHANNTHGTVYSFYINIRKMILHRPDGYREESADKLLNSEKKETVVTDVKNMPNVIAIMNESFSDLSVVGDFETEKDYMPFIRDLEENTVKGELLVSPFGGNTCNTEFEFLTGLSMGMLPSGSTPYLQYITKKYPLSLPSHMANLGYDTVAIHPYYGRCWNRQKVYSLFGFDNFISIDNLNSYVNESEWEYIRHYLSDNTSYKAVINQLNTKNPDDRMFIFNVTMQNHGGYNYEETAFEGIKITNLKGEYPETEQYLALVKESDEAFEELLTYLKDYNEPTIVVMFGDHQPAVEQEFFEELYGNQLSKVDIEELQTRYTIPFVIWANYDIESKNDIHTSPNYLSNLLLDTAGIPKNELGMFTSKISEKIPQLNLMGHYDSDGVWNTNDLKTNQELKKYEDVEYYLITRKEE